MKALEGNHESRVLKHIMLAIHLVLDCSGNNENFIKFLHKVDQIESNVIDLGVNHLNPRRKMRIFKILIMFLTNTALY